MSAVNFAYENNDVAAIREYYLDWVNNYLTLELFAENHEISATLASKIIAAGRIIHNARFERN